VHERSVGAVFKQPAHQIRQQFVETADGRIDSAGHRAIACEHAVKGFTHSVQALELEFRIAREFEDRGHRAAVMRRKRRVDRIRGREQRLRANDIGQIGRAFSGVNRVVGKPAQLCALDFGIPVGTLDQSHHKTPAGVARERYQPVAESRRAPLVSLYRNAETVPTPQRRLGGEPLEQVEL